MGLISKIKEILSRPPSHSRDKDLIRLKVKCDKCSVEIDSVFRKNYDLQISYEGESYAYLIDKNLVCPGCYSKINLRMELDKSFKQMNKEVINGQILEEGKSL